MEPSLQREVPNGGVHATFLGRPGAWWCPHLRLSGEQNSCAISMCSTSIPVDANSRFLSPSLPLSESRLSPRQWGYHSSQHCGRRASPLAGVRSACYFQWGFGFCGVRSVADRSLQVGGAKHLPGIGWGESMPQECHEAKQKWIWWPVNLFCIAGPCTLYSLIDGINLVQWLLSTELVIWDPAAPLPSAHVHLGSSSAGLCRQWSGIESTEICVEHNATMWINGGTTCTFVQQYAQIDSQMLHVVSLYELSRPVWLRNAHWTFVTFVPCVWNSKTAQGWVAPLGPFFFCDEGLGRLGLATERSPTNVRDGRGLLWTVGSEEHGDHRGLTWIHRRCSAQQPKPSLSSWRWSDVKRCEVMWSDVKCEGPVYQTEGMRIDSDRCHRFNTTPSILHIV